jgi:magnesium transporter
MGEASSSARTHHQQLEQTRAQVIDLLSRQAIERELVLRSEKRNPDLISHMLERQQRAQLEQRLLHLHPADIAFVLESIAADARAFAWSLVRPERRGAVLLEISETARAELVASMSPGELAKLAASLGSKDIAQLLSSLPDEVQSQVFALLDQDEQREVRSVLSFPSGSVGAAMDLELITVSRDSTLADVQARLRGMRELPRHTSQLFVVDAGQRLCGVLELTRLLLDDPQTRVAAAMQPPAAHFHTDDRMRDAAQAFEKYTLLAAPVMNLHEQLVGRITVDAVVEDIHARAQSENLRQVGLSPEDEDLLAPLWQAARRRWPWLAINLCSAFLASRVIGQFEPLIARLAALAALMPIVASIGGNAGNQSAALVLQGMAGHGASRSRLLRILWRETGVGVLSGALLGPALAAVTLILYGDVRLALVTGLALLCNLVFAAAIGVGAPLLLARLGRDPLLGSSIILTASTDSFGFFVFLGLAARLLT